MKTTTRWMTRLIAVCLSFAGFMHSAQATLVSTEQVAASEGVTSVAEQRAYVNSMLDRADVAQALQERGIDLAQAKARVAALTDAEVAHVAHKDGGISLSREVLLTFEPRSVKVVGERPAATG